MDNKNTEKQFFPRTDLACECRDLLCEKGARDIDGIESGVRNIKGIRVETVTIKNESGAEKLGKPCGRYITVETEKLYRYSENEFEQLCDICAEILSEVIPKEGSCLLAALGNRNITADSQGPLCAEYFVVTHHIKMQNPELFKQLGLRDTLCVIPDVLGNTGVESASIIKGVVEKEKPDFVIAVDSLASRKTDRLCATLQISDAGISPGSGVGNHRQALDRRSLGIPVIAIGVPTVVDAVTVSADVLEEAFSKRGSADDEIKRKALSTVLSDGTYGYFVTPKNADIISECSAKLIARSINKALNPDLSYADMTDLC